jgi:AraC-like DNA-binding protein
MNLNAESDRIIPQIDNVTQGAFKKYLPVSGLDRKWGFNINDIGHTGIPKNSYYPSLGHPGSHMFSWETGRILNEFHFVMITEGEGIFESKSAGEACINKGDGFLLFPGEWHRYKPVKKTGWTENWVGFSGQIADIIMNESFFSKELPIIQKCGNMLLLNLFKSMTQLISEEPFGFQRTASGVCLQLIAELCNIQKGAVLSEQANSLISTSKHLIRKKIDEEIDFHTFCKNHGISYSKFRSDFKHQTGFAPLQYFLLMKIEKAKDQLKSTDLKAKQIAYNLGFKSDHYFGRIFKFKTDMTPKAFRRKYRKEGL